MKKRLSWIFICLMVILSTYSPAFAVVTVEDTIGFMLNQELQSWDEFEYGEIILENSRCFIPLKIVSEKLGFSVEWNGADRTILISKDAQQILFKINSTGIYTPSGSSTLDVAPFIRNERAYVPMSGLFKALNYDVAWLTGYDLQTKYHFPALQFDRDHYVVVSTATDETSNISHTDTLHEQWVKDHYVEWGLGTTFKSYVGNNRSYDWYINQQDTGTYSGNNCGPSSTIMMAKWLNPNFTDTAEMARNKYLLEGGWWYTNTITAYYDSVGIDYKYLSFNKSTYQDNINLLKTSLKNGEISLLCTEIGKVPYSTEATRVNRFYVFDSGHFLVVKGYVEVDDKTYFEVYDPNNWDFYYPDGTPMGRDRYYEANALMHAVQVWWPYAITVAEPK